MQSIQVNCYWCTFLLVLSVQTVSWVKSFVFGDPYSYLWTLHPITFISMARCVSDLNLKFSYKIYLHLSLAIYLIVLDLDLDFAWGDDGVLNDEDELVGLEVDALLLRWPLSQEQSHLLRLINCLVCCEKLIPLEFAFQDYENSFLVDSILRWLRYTKPYLR